MVRIGIFGASGYAGHALLRRVERHPETELVFATSHGSAGRPLRDIYPTVRADIQLVDHAAALAIVDSVDVVFLCLPHGTSARFANEALLAGRIVIDLSADFRIDDASIYSKWYGTTHPHPERLEESVYGLSEFARDAVSRSDLIANPGCYATSVLLALLPLWRAGAIGAGMPIIADSKSGVSGAGRKPLSHTHFVSVNENFSSYSIGRQHRHLPEMLQCLEAHSGLHKAYGLGGRSADSQTQLVPTEVDGQQAASSASARLSLQPDLIFSPHLLPVSRGILSTIYAPLADDWSAADARRCLETAYAEESFVALLPQGEHAQLAHVVRSNRVAIGIEPPAARSSSPAASTIW